MRHSCAGFPLSGVVGGRYGARGGGGGGVGGWGALALPMEMSLPEEVVNFGLLQPPYLFLICKT